MDSKGFLASTSGRLALAITGVALAGTGVVAIVGTGTFTLVAVPLLALVSVAGFIPTVLFALHDRWDVAVVMLLTLPFALFMYFGFAWLVVGLGAGAGVPLLLLGAAAEGIAAGGYRLLARGESHDHGGMLSSHAA